MAEKRVSIKVTEEHLKFIEKVAKSRDIELNEAVDHVMTTAVTRMNALAKYAKKQSSGKKPKKAAKKAAPKKAAKKAAPKKAAKRAAPRKAKNLKEVNSVQAPVDQASSTEASSAE